MSELVDLVMRLIVAGILMLPMDAHGMSAIGQNAIVDEQGKCLVCRAYFHGFLRIDCECRLKVGDHELETISTILRKVSRRSQANI